MAVAMGVAAGALATVWVPAPAAQAVGAALAVAVFGMVSARGKAQLDKRAAQREALPRHVLAAGAGGRPRRVRELDDPIALGVHPAEAITRVLDGQNVVNRVPPYVPRDIQQRLQELVAAGGFVLLVGDSTAGKTRAGYEAIRVLLADHVLIAPAGRGSLVAAVLAAEAQRRCVVWLDDLERFLGSSGLTANMVGRLLGDGHRDVLVLATMRSHEYDRYSTRAQAWAEGGTARESWRVGREVIELALIVEVQRRWTSTELGRASDFADDPRIRGAMDNATRFGLAELLAAGPELAADWRNAWRAGGHPRGAALVAAAVDCRRAGLHDPMPLDLLDDLAEHYLEQEGGALLRPEPLADAINWATTPSHGTSSLLLPSGAQGLYLAFDYLIDLPGLPAIPRTTWQALIEHSSPRQAFEIGNAADQQLQWDIAVHAYQKAVDHETADADVALAQAVGSAGGRTRAKRMLAGILAASQRALHPNSLELLRIRQEFALSTARAGDPARAVELLTDVVADYRSVLGSDHPDTLSSRRALALWAGQTGDIQRAVDLYTTLLPDGDRVLGPDHPDTIWSRHCLAYLLRYVGRTQQALQLVNRVISDRERVLGSDHHFTLNARHLRNQLTLDAGEPAHAAELFADLFRDRARILGPGHRYTISARIEQVHALAKAGQLDKARTLLNDVVANWGRNLGREPRALDLVQCAAGTAVLCTTTGRRDLAEFHWTCEQLLGSDHPLTKDAAQLLAAPLR
jgi:tetratricopeptide (TPR) repeat protein